MTENPVSNVATSLFIQIVWFIWYQKGVSQTLRISSVNFFFLWVQIQVYKLEFAPYGISESSFFQLKTGKSTRIEGNWSLV